MSPKFPAASISCSLAWLREADDRGYECLLVRPLILGST